MTVENAYVAPFAAAVKAKSSSKPVFVAGRINQPQIAEQILAAGQADMCGMTRAHDLRPGDAGQGASAAGSTTSAPASPATRPASAISSMGYPISCIQHPETGRELRLRPALRPAAHSRKRAWSPAAARPA